jgi:hypothetical protein
MRSTIGILCLLTAAFAHAAMDDTVTVNLGVADPATPRAYAVAPGAFVINLTNADPRKTYEIVGENRRKATDPKLPSGFKAAADIGCDATEPAAIQGQMARVIAVALQAKLDKTPADKRADVKVTEADISDALSGDFACLSADDKKKLDDDKKKLGDDENKLKTAQDQLAAGTVPADPNLSTKEKQDTEKTRIDKEKLRIARIDASNADPEKLKKHFALSFGDYAIKTGETIQKTFKAVGEDTTWTVVVTTQGESAAATARAAAKAASPIAGDSPILDRLLSTTATQPDLVVGSCKYTDTTCAARIFINADQISTLTVTDIPAGAVTVRITAGEFYPCGAISYNIARFSKAPDTLILPLQMRKGFLGIGSTTVAGAEAEAASIYGLDWCPGTEVLLRKQNRFSPSDMSDKEYRDYILKRERQNETVNLLSTLEDPRTHALKAPPIASLPLFLRGRSQVVELQFAWDDGHSKTFTFPVVYQRFWLDAGGFFVFARRTDQSITTATIPGAAGPPAVPEMQQVLSIRRDVSIEPNTGIVINIHPGNFPILAFQFGIAANQGRLPSYYFGLGFRAREIGKRGLATLGVGVAMQQEQQFPGLEFGQQYPSTDPRLKAASKYGVTFPYLSLSLGFSFGGVSEKTNVADSVQQ